MARTVEDASRDLSALSRELKETGNGELRKELMRGMRDAGREIPKGIRSGVLSTMPSRGGFADLLAGSDIKQRNSLSGAYAKVRFTGANSAIKDVDALNRGRLRHPLFGNRAHWFNQTVPAGWFDVPIEQQQPEFLQAINRVLDDIKSKLERSV